MPTRIRKGIFQLVEEANQIVEEISITEALALHGKEDVQFVDIRDIRELDREGRVPGAYHCPRGMLEFWVDPESPYAKTAFQQEVTFVLFCAAGMRSALAGRTLVEMGLPSVKHIQGGFAAWRENGGEVNKG